MPLQADFKKLLAKILHQLFLHLLTITNFPFSSFANGFENTFGFSNKYDSLLIFIAVFFFDNCEL